MGELYQTLKYQYSTTFPENKKEIFPYSSYEASIILIPKPDRDVERKENCKLITLININIKIFNETIANRIQQHTKSITHYCSCQIYFKNARLI